MDNSSYKIKSKDINDKHIEFVGKKQLVNLVEQESNRKKNRNSTTFEPLLDDAISNTRLFNTGRPTKETMKGRKHISFSSLVE